PVLDQDWCIIILQFAVIARLGVVPVQFLLMRAQYLFLCSTYNLFFPHGFCYCVDYIIIVCGNALDSRKSRLSSSFWPWGPRLQGSMGYQGRRKARPLRSFSGGSIEYACDGC